MHPQWRDRLHEWAIARPFHLPIAEWSHACGHHYTIVLVPCPVCLVGGLCDHCQLERHLQTDHGLDVTRSRQLLDQMDCSECAEYLAWVACPLCGAGVCYGCLGSHWRDKHLDLDRRTRHHLTIALWVSSVVRFAVCHPIAAVLPVWSIVSDYG